MKKIILLIILTLTNTLAAKEVREEPQISKEKNRFFGYSNLGLAFVETESLNNKDHGSKHLVNFNLGARYSFFPVMGINLSIGKWLSSGDFTYNSGSLAYNVEAGFVFALSGNLQSEKTTEILNKRKELKKDGKFYFASQKETLTKLNNLDGFRLGVNINQLSFSRFDDEVYGGNVSLYYEHRAGKYAIMQYGGKYETVNSNFVKVDMVQLFIGIGFMP